MTEIDSSYLLDSNHDNEENFEYYNNDYHDDEINFDNLDLDEPLEEERDTSTTLTFHNKRTSK
ncbi:15761_t:CDS:1, partial [Funneliformis caledonium]